MINDFGGSSSLARRFIGDIYNILVNISAPEIEVAYQRWKRSSERIYGSKLDVLQTLSEDYIPDEKPLDFSFLLFALQTYYAILLKFIAVDIASHIYNEPSLSYHHNDDHSTWTDELLSLTDSELRDDLLSLEEEGLLNQLGIVQDPEERLFSWYLKNNYGNELCDNLREVIAKLGEYELVPLIDNPRDLLKGLYHDLFPRSIRHKLGEYYTPDWLAELALNELEYDGDPHKRILDPAAGSGTFVIASILRAKDYAEREGIAQEEALNLILENIVCFDLNPLAVLMSRVNYLLALGRELFLLGRKIEIPVYLCDPILSSHFKREANSFAEVDSESFDYIAGNPPWVNWEDLPDDYKRSTKEIWDKYGIFSHSGLRARLGGSKDDIAILMTYVAIERYLKRKGKLGFVITRSLFKTKGGGEGFRKFKITDKTPIRVIKVDDLSELKPFEGANNRVALFICSKGEATRYPVPYTLWRRRDGISIDPSYSLEEVIGLTDRVKLEAKPVDDYTSPWITTKSSFFDLLERMGGKTEYRAREGVNTGGANGVYWIEIVDGDDRLLVENLDHIGRKKIQKYRDRVEKDLVYPLLRGRNISRWRSSYSCYIIIPCDPDEPKLRFASAEMSLRFPRTYSYLSHFKDILLSRKSSSIPKNPFYSLFGLGPYTFSPYKVVWRALYKEIAAVVVSKREDRFLSARYIIPEHNVMFIPLWNEDEAHYLCAILNSSLVNFAMRSYAPLFYSTHLLSYLRIPKYDPELRLHRELSSLSSKAHLNSEEDDELRHIQEELDLVICKLWNVKKGELSEVKEYLKEMVIN